MHFGVGVVARLGDLVRAKVLLRSAARAFGPKEAVARARCVVAEAEVAIGLDIEVLSRAYDAAASAHHDQNRLSGEKFIEHPLSVAAILAGIWIGTSFWGAMDTAFCRIYHVECRGWVEQKRFAFGMLIVVFLFLGASVVLPTVEGSLVASTTASPSRASAPPSSARGGPSPSRRRAARPPARVPLRALRTMRNRVRSLRSRNG